MMINKSANPNEINSLNQQGLITVLADLSTALFYLVTAHNRVEITHNAKPAESIRLIFVKSNSMIL